MKIMEAIGYRAKCVLKLSLQLGEGPLWDESRQKLFFLDIDARQVHWFDPVSMQHDYHLFKKQPTTLARRKDGTMLIALEDELIGFNPETGASEPLVKLPIYVNVVRTNDGGVGPDSRYYLGTMDRRQKHPTAAFYRVEPSGEVAELLDDRTISNGVAWSLDGRTMYYIDSPTHKIQAYDFDPKAGTIGRPRTLVETSPDDGLPDGMTIDAAGNLWAAHNGAGHVACYHGQSGELLAEIKVPCPKVSSCCFGGADRRTLFITTEREGMDEREIRHHPLSGSLFAVRLPVPGAVGFSFGK